MKLINEYALAKAEGHVVIIHEESLNVEKEVNWRFKLLRNGDDKALVDVLVETKQQGIWKFVGFSKEDARTFFKKTLFLGKVIDGDLAVNELIRAK